MVKWQALRLQRAKEQDLHCANFTFTDDSAVFWIIGLTGQYEVEVNQDVDIPPTCTCEDHAWRSDVCFCKHILFVLRELGAVDQDLADCCWELQQADIYELLSSAPAVIDSYRVRSSAQLTSDY